VFRAYLFGLLMTAVTALVGSELGKPQYNLGNPLIAWRHLNEAADPSEVLLEVSLGYALFHAALAVVCCMWALLALRRIAQAEAGAAAVAAKPVEEGNWAGDIKRPHRQKPPVTEPALVWKEMNDEPFGWAGRNPFLDSMMVFFAWVVFPIFLLLTMFLGDTPLAAEVVNPMTRLFGTGIMMCTFVLIGLNAAGRFSREVERQTLDNLLTVPDRQGILFAKWWASVLHVRGLWWVLAWLWFLGVLSGGLHVLAVPLLALAALTYSSFVAALGVWLSLVMGSTLRASLATLLAAAGVTLGTWLVAGMASTALQFGPTPLERLADAFQEWGAAAPCTLWVLAIPFAEIRDRAWRAAPAQDLLAGLIGVVYYAGLTALIWSRARLRFRSLLQGTMQTTRAA
jgi:ABC-type transport system involved in multi-copper enzyme maturation permease subunit